MNLTPADRETILLTAAAATVPCVVFDVIVRAIHQWQRKRAGVVDRGSFGPVGHLFFSLILNYVMCGGFAYLYYIISAHSGDAFLWGGILWLMVAIPLLLTSRYMDEVQQKILGTRILGWFFKSAAAAASVAYFIG